MFLCSRGKRYKSLHLGVSPYVLEPRRRQSVAISRAAAPYVLMSLCPYVSRVSGYQATLRRQPISILAYYHINKPCSKHLWQKYLQSSLILPNFAVKLTL